MLYTLVNQVTISAESILIKGISHDIRRSILKLVDEFPRTFTDLLNYFDISTGKLTYHLSQINGFVAKKDGSSLYEITSLGKKALKVLDMIDNEMKTENDQKLVKEAFVAQKNAGTPLIVKGISIMIVMLSFIIVLHGSMFIGLLVMYNELQGAVIIFPILVALIGIELAGLLWLVQVRRSSPLFIEKLSKHLQDDS